MIDWQKDCKDAMWSMFWIGQENGKEYDSEHCKDEIKALIARLVRMSTQRTAGQRGNAKHLDFDSLGHTMENICIIATEMALHGEFGEMPNSIEGDCG